MLPILPRTWICTPKLAAAMVNVSLMSVGVDESVIVLELLLPPPAAATSQAEPVPMNAPPQVIEDPTG